jgi:8-oxo-dGTP pyrophosphatase MutT (NUDIX family)
MNPNPITYTGAGALLFSEDRLVIEVRKAHKWERKPGRPPVIGIGSVGGSIETGESPIEALHRETREEVNCDIDVFSSPQTVCVSPRGVSVDNSIVIDGIQPAMIWVVGDPTFVVGSYVAVFRAQASGDPSPGDLPAIILTSPDLLTEIGFGSITVEETLNFGAEIRAQIDIPSDGRLVLANTMRHLMTIRETDASLYHELVAPTEGV